MPEVVAFLMSETEKQEHLIEKMLATDEVDGCSLEDIQRIVQSTFNLYNSVEQVRTHYPHWVLIDGKRVYDSIKALISLDCLPEPCLSVGLPKKAKDSVVAGYLYVFHVFQVHTHAMGPKLRFFSDLDGSLHRLFCSTQQDLIIRRQFLEKIRSEFNSDDHSDLALGVECAFQEIGALQKSKRNIKDIG